jgi:RNA polymerase sigma-70 factor, ECF subfamily
MNTAQEDTGSQSVWEDFHGRLRSFVSRRVKQPADAEDVVQEIFLHIHRNLSTVKDEARLPAWIFTIARNAIVDYFRKNARPAEAFAEDFDLPAPTEQSEIDHSALQELAHCLEPMIEDLPESYRHAIRLTELRGLAQSEAAKQTGLSVSGMKTRVQRARRKLKTMLLQCCEIQFDNRRGVVAYQPRSGGCCPCVAEQQNRTLCRLNFKISPHTQGERPEDRNPETAFVTVSSAPKSLDAISGIIYEKARTHPKSVPDNRECNPRRDSYPLG